MPKHNTRHRWLAVHTLRPAARGDHQAVLERRSWPPLWRPTNLLVCTSQSAATLTLLRSLTPASSPTARALHGTQLFNFLLFLQAPGRVCKLMLGDSVGLAARSGYLCGWWHSIPALNRALQCLSQVAHDAPSPAGMAA